MYFAMIGELRGEWESESIILIQFTETYIEVNMVFWKYEL